RAGSGSSGDRVERKGKTHDDHGEQCAKHPCVLLCGLGSGNVHAAPVSGLSIKSGWLLSWSQGSVDLVQADVHVRDLPFTIELLPDLRRGAHVGSAVVGVDQLLGQDLVSGTWAQHGAR